MVFVTGTFAWWAPAAIDHAQAMKQHLNHTSDLPKSDRDSVALVFGAITVLSGFVGVAAGTVWAQAWKEGKWCLAACKTSRADPLVSAIGEWGLGGVELGEF